MVKQFVRALALLVFIAVGSAEAGTVALQWDPNPEPDIAGYIVSYGTASGQYYATADVGTQTSFEASGLDPATIYYFSVQAYNTAGIHSAHSAEVSVNGGTSTLSLTSISTDVASPQTVGTTVTLAATANNGLAPYKYKWLISNGTTWTVGQDWSTNSKFAWTPGAANANYRVGVWVTNTTSTSDAPDNPSSSGDIPFSILAPPTVSPSVLTVGVTANKSAPQLSGTKILFTASATGASAYQYKWWVFDGANWSVAQEWSKSNKFTWAPNAANSNYQVLVRAQNAKNPAESAGTSMPFPINDGGGSGSGGSGGSGGGGGGRGNGKP